jgi:CO/xanthine dehydrogenase Mo-binding subunit
VGTTDHFLTDVAVAASRVTYLASQASQKAASGLRDVLLHEAAEIFACPLERLGIDKNFPCNGVKQKISFAELAARAASKGRKLQVTADFKIQERGGAACFFAQAAKIKVDPETRKIRILKMLSAHAAGTVINHGPRP